jgi:hypothetical protein
VLPRPDLQLDDAHLRLSEGRTVRPGSPPIALELAEALRGAFRSAPPSPERLSAALLQSAQVSGLGALVARRLGSEVEGEAAEELRSTERFQLLEVVRREKLLGALFGRLGPHGIAAVTFKGWSLARLYARPGLRPVGDVDLLVAPADLAHARNVVAGLPPEPGVEIDLQADVARFLPDRSVASLIAGGETVATGAGPVRVPSTEDHLRLICLHQLHHGAWRPLWLCDVAVLLESLPPGFSWDRALAGNAHLSEGVMACVGLAEEWLGARPSVAPPPHSVPDWFRRAVRAAWERGFRPPPDRLEGISWSRLPTALRSRWPDPLSSTLHLDAPFRGVPRLPIQMAEAVRRGARHALRRMRSVESRGEGSVRR